MHTALERCPRCGRPALRITGQCLGCALRETGLALPARIGPYPILREIGSGGMGTVFCGVQHCPRREVAIKVMLDGVLAEPGLRAKFLAEREIAGRFEHPNIIRLYDAGEDADCQPYYVMELAQRGTLAELLRTAGSSLSQEDRVRMLIDVALAVDHAHGLGVLHRDLKPSNILIGLDMRPRVTDFGVAKLLPPTAARGLDETGTVVGSWAYMAPEQAGLCGHAVGVAADVYSLGAILYELLSGAPAYGVRSRDELQRALGGGPVPALRRQAPHVSRDLEAVVLMALEHTPERRHASAAELASDLRAAIAGRQPRARPRTLRGRTVSKLARQGSRLSLWVGIWLLSLGALLSLNQTLLRESVRHNQALKQQTTQVAGSLARILREQSEHTAELASDPLARSALERGVTPGVEGWLAQRVTENALWSSAYLIATDGRVRAYSAASGRSAQDVELRDHAFLRAAAHGSDGEVLVSPLFRPGATEELQLALSVAVYAEPGHMPCGVAVSSLSVARLARELDLPPLTLLAPRERAAASGGVELVEVIFDREGGTRVAPLGERARALYVAKLEGTDYAVMAPGADPPLSATRLGSWLWALAATVMCAAGFGLSASRAPA